MSDLSDRPKSLEDLKQKIRDEIGPRTGLGHGTAGQTGVDAESSEQRGFEREDEATRTLEEGPKGPDENL